VRALVVGGGAVGSLLAWALAEGGAAVTLVRRRAPGAGLERLTVAGPGRSRSTADLAIAPSADALDTEPDVIVLAVKVFDVAEAAASLPTFASATLLTVQNGFGSEDAVRAVRPRDLLVAGSLTAAVDLQSDGTVRWLRRGGIGLASVLDGGASSAVNDDVRGVARDLATAFGHAGLSSRVYPDWRAMKWSKLIANLVGNATSALVDRSPASIYADPRLFEIEREQLLEAFAVVRGLGLRPVSLPGADVTRLELALALPAPVARTILGVAVGGGRGGKDPSLRLAFAARSETTEVQWLNGAVVRSGEALGIATPVNRALTELVERAAGDDELRQRLRGRPEALTDAVAGYRARPDAPVESRPAGG